MTETIGTPVPIAGGYTREDIYTTTTEDVSCCCGECVCAVSDLRLCGAGVDVKVTMGGTCNPNTSILVYSVGIGYSNGITTINMGTCGTGAAQRYCATAIIIAPGQASYHYEGTVNPCLTPVTMNFTGSDGICEADLGLVWPATMTLGPP